MELTPELLLEAKFGPSRRGYDMEEVDDFLERVAAGLDVLLGRLTNEFTRAEEAEAEVARLQAAASTGSAPEATPQPAAATPEAVAPAANLDEPLRVLMHAERTAAAVIEEATNEAKSLTEAASTEATAKLTEADSVLDKARTAAEIEARKAGEAARAEVQTEVDVLRRDRDDLASQMRTFKRWLDENRAKVRVVARDLQRLADDPKAMAGDDLPDAALETVAEPAGDDATVAVPVVPASDATTDPADAAKVDDEALVDVTSNGIASAIFDQGD